MAAPPRSHSSEVLLPSPASIEPAKDGNYAVIERIAHEALDELQTGEPTGEVVERVKTLCAERRIDYGRHPDVPADVVRRAVESAAAQRTLVPVRSTGRGGSPTPLGELAQEFRKRLDAMQERARGA